MEDFLLVLLIGLLSGIFSGAFGLGGSTITIPLLRIALNLPGHMVIGTSLPMVVPTALSGLYVFFKKDILDWRIILTTGMVGSVFSIAGAYFTIRFTGSQLMLFTAALLFLSALLIFSRVATKFRIKKREKILRAAAIGAIAGFISGFLGIGGGSFLVPLFILLLGLSIHEAIGCALGTIIIYAIPGSATHFVLGNVDMDILLTLLAGSIIGAQIGSRFVTRIKERNLKVFLAAFYAILGLVLAVNEYVIPWLE